MARGIIQEFASLPQNFSAERRSNFIPFRNFHFFLQPSVTKSKGGMSIDRVELEGESYGWFIAGKFKLPSLIICSILLGVKLFPQTNFKKKTANLVYFILAIIFQNNFLSSNDFKSSFERSNNLAQLYLHRNIFHPFSTTKTFTLCSS